MAEEIALRTVGALVPVIDHPRFESLVRLEDRQWRIRFTSVDGPDVPCDEATAPQLEGAMWAARVALRITDPVPELFSGPAQRLAPVLRLPGFRLLSISRDLGQRLVATVEFTGNDDPVDHQVNATTWRAAVAGAYEILRKEMD